MSIVSNIPMKKFPGSKEKISMNALQLLTTTSKDAVVEAYNRICPEDPVTLEDYQTLFLDVIKAKVLIASEYKLTINHLETRYVDPKYHHMNSTEWRVNLETKVSDGVYYSTSFTAWGEMLACEVECPMGLPLEEQAAHIFYEMTFYGTEADTTDKQDDLLDLVEQIERGETEELIDEGKITILSTNSETDILDQIFPDMSEAEKAEIRETALAKVEHYRNGVLHGNDDGEPLP
jgi:hypothetical protein